MVLRHLVQECPFLKENKKADQRLGLVGCPSVPQFLPSVFVYNAFHYIAKLNDEDEMASIVFSFSCFMLAVALFHPFIAIATMSRSPAAVRNP